MDGDLPRRWRRLGASWGAPPERVRRVGADLLARWSEPHRRYHTLEHLGEVLQAFDRFGGQGLPHEGRDAEAALWFHDAVYEAGATPGSDEAASAALARRVLSELGAPAGSVAEVARLVEFTSGHVEGRLAHDRAAAVVCDADLAVLGAPGERYRRYAGQVRAEYSAVSDEAWKRGRSEVLERLLHRPRLYITPEAFSALEDLARANLAWELTTLGGGEAQPGALEPTE
ncbi:MAG TPA: hypothetical protein VFP54_11390 [Acidimicrobiales bacterium]|nr:hypothetical protein [Acidimicrobiales bacterium]